MEGETEDDHVNQFRHRQARNLMATLILAGGVPMLTAGDELGRTQQGNNNAYCQDSHISWVHWDTAGTWGDQLDLPGACSNCAPSTRSFSGTASAHGEFLLDPAGKPTGRKNLAWFGGRRTEMSPGEWHDGTRRTLGMYLASDDPDRPNDDALLIWFHGGADPVQVELPDGPWAHTYSVVAHTGVDGELPAEMRLEHRFSGPLRRRARCAGRRLRLPRVHPGGVPDLGQLHEHREVEQRRLRAGAGRDVGEYFPAASTSRPASAAAAAGMILGPTMDGGWSIAVALAATAVFGLFLGLLNGFMITRLRISYLVVTLGTLSIYQSFALVVNSGRTITVFGDPGFSILSDFVNNDIGPFPILLVFDLLLSARRRRHPPLHRVRPGRCSRSARTGRRRGSTASTSGALCCSPTGIAGLAAGLASVVQVGRLTGASAQADPTLLLTVIAAVLIGGTIFTGGEGGVLGTLVGVLFLGVVQNGLTLSNVSSFWQGTGQRRDPDRGGWARRAA